MRRNGKSLKNRIWILAVLALLTILSAAGMRSAFPTALALEQAARCGMEEHVHSENCYVGDILVCREKMHTHTENCYLVLLADNDINELLTRVDASEDNSLESLISATVLRAASVAQLNTDADYEGPVAPASPGPSVSPTVTPSLIPTITPSASPSLSPSADPESTPTASPSQSVITNQPLSVTQAAQPITNEQIVALNEATDTSRNGVVLNEHLVTPGLTGNAGEGQLLDALLTGGTGGDAGILALPTTPESGRVANFYIWLDESQFVYIGAVDLSNSNPDYATKTQIAALYNTDDIISNISANGIETGNQPNSGTQVRYRTNIPAANTDADDFSSNGNRVGNSGNNANRIGFGNTGNARYATLMTGTRVGNQSNYTPINFYTVTLDYSQVDSTKASDVQYVQSGLDATLSLSAEYLWYDAAEGGSEVTAEDLQNIKSTTTLYARPRSRTVTFETNGGSPVASQTVMPGGKATRPADPLKEGNTFGGWYTDTIYTTQYDFDAEVTRNITLYAKWIPDVYTVTLIYKDPGGNEIRTEELRIDHGDAVTLDEAYNWVAENGTAYEPGTAVTVKSDLTFVGTKRTYTISYYNVDGAVMYGPFIVEHGEEHTVSYTLPPGCTAWVDIAYSDAYDPTDEQTIIVKRNYGFKATSQYTVTYINEDGRTTSEMVDPGGEVTLPSLDRGYVWVLDGDTIGTTYAGGATYKPVNDNLTFRAVRALTLDYDLEPPTDLSNAANNSSILPNAPTIAGESATEATRVVSEGGSAVLLTAAPNKVTSLAESLGETYNYHVVGYFVGWQVENTGTVLLPSDTYSYAELSAYDTDNDGVVHLTGVWDDGWNVSANFFIKYNSNPDGSGEPDDYTPSLFTTYIGLNGYSPGNVTIEGNSSATAAQAPGYDEDIRLREGYREGNGTDGIWIYEIPSDDLIFAGLQEYVKSMDENATAITVEGQPVLLEELTSETFAIRWFVFKHQSSDGWHIDGILVRKEGNITVTKTFDGRTDYVSAAQNGFTITARKGTMDDNGIFTDDAAETDITLLVSREVQDSDTTTIGYDSRVEATAANGSTEVTYTWTIPEVGAGEVWNISENLVQVDSAVGFGEWVIVDSSNVQSDSGIGTETSVIGVTFPKDVSSDEWLRVDFTNVYYSQNSILLRKVDGLSGEKLDGAQFKLWQRVNVNGVETEVPMTFDLEVSTDANGNIYHTYVYAPNGDGAYDTITCDGTEINISVEEFSYGNGPIVVREVQAPAGYVLAENEVVVGYVGTTDNTGTAVIGILNDDASSGYADFRNGLLIVKNFAPTVDLTVQKVWRNCTTDEWADYVVVQLLADGSANKAAGVLPDGVSTIQTLRKVIETDGSLTYETYTWTDLPVYIGGVRAEWSVKELQIGDEELKEDGTFPNWLSFVSLAQYSEDGTAAMVTVTNNPKAGTELRIVKMDTDKTVQLPGATFTIEDVDGTILGTETTDETGELIFHRLKYDVVYTIREITFPTGYRGSTDPIRITISENGTVSILENNGYAEPGASAFSLRVLNQSTAVLLPNTGGHGTIGYYAAGMALMLLALSVAILPKLRKRGRYQMRD